jgi:hypothetical protein
LKQLHELFYSTLQLLDTSVEKNEDGLFADLIWRLLYEESDVDIKNIQYWIKYLRFNICFFKNININTVIFKNFDFILPNDKIVQSNY